MIQAVIFDFDGLIIDTETIEYQVLQDIFHEHQADLPLEIWGKAIGASAEAFDVIAYLEGQIGRKVDREAFTAQRHKKIMAALAQEKARPGVENVLQEAKRLGLQIGLASSSRYAWIDHHLRHLGLLDVFDCIRTAENVTHVKPEPTLYQTVAEYLDVHPHEAIAFEDSANGAMAAKRAGMYCIVVPNEVTKAMDFGDVNHRLASMEGVALAALIDEVTERS